MEIIRQLYQRNYYRLFRMAYIVTGGRDTAEDAIHNGFIKAINGLERVRNPDKLDSWIYTIVRNEALLLIRKNKRVVLFHGKEDSAPSDFTVDTPEQWVIRGQCKELIVKIIETMSPILKEVIYLRYYTGLNLKEIADLLGENQSTIRMRHMRAKEYLYQSLLNQIDNLG